MHFQNFGNHWKRALNVLKRKQTSREAGASSFLKLVLPLQRKKAYTLPKRGSLQVLAVAVTNFGSEGKPML